MNLKLNISRGKVKQYQFGYSLFEDIATVTNWQIGNNTFLNVPSGTYYIFAKPLNGNEDDFISIKISPKCASDVCTISTNGFADTTITCVISTNGYADTTASPTTTAYTFQYIPSYGS
jgi:hypothetical protein